MRKSVTKLSCLLAAAFLLGGCLQVLFATEDDVTPRISFPYNANERLAKRFSVDGILNYTLLLLSQEDDMLYVGAREALFALSLSDISKTKLQKNLMWGTPPGKREECSFKGKNLETDCFNYIKILLRMNSTHLYVCGTYAFSPVCAYIVSDDLSFC
ncbi:semaphorin-4B-like [Takifugu flavidus]|uniref:Semaphorin-4B n=1 Tax=Takifugu flavidus TaxID=433684 RepID=A0A5C6NJC1_9TELE|nr:semaphorin-4B-like [Takifugu flavidus]TWW67323.1 Semaphorin-4B Precursor [Takifugu flavidus]